MRSIEFGIRDVISCGGLELNTSINVQIREFHVLLLDEFINTCGMNLNHDNLKLGF